VDAEVVRFAAELIRLDTSNRGGGDCKERPAAEYVAERLAEAGYQPEMLESAPGRANTVVRIEGTDRYAPALLLHGHLDVVPAEPTDWSVPPFAGEVRDGVLWGRGAVDMKNADAVILAVVREWARTGWRPSRDVVLAFTADEEASEDDLLAEDPAAHVVPYCMTGGTDGKQFARLGMACYGFTPLVLPPGFDYYAMFHGVDERIPVSALESGVRIVDTFFKEQSLREL
jgi:acetylornithine deacetylase/succinyl-diaminopimelate desuccinylase-like protein